VTVADATLLIIRLSDSFGEFWPLLGQELSVPVVDWRPADGETLPPGGAVVVIAAGGAELDLPTFLRALTLPSDIPIAAVGGATSHRVAAHAVAAGAADYFALPDDRDALRDFAAAALTRRRATLARATHARLEAEAHAFREIVGDSPALRATLERAARVLPHADATILITGETGTGKELMSRALHYGGPRAAAPFVELNCAAIPAQLLESELFGHERGAFTDAKTAKPGLFEAAEGGTLLLDEINRLAHELQAKLLRALEEKTVRRLGSTTTRRVDVRIIAATNAELTTEVREGRFREDLFYRLNVVSLHLPALRERGDDVLLLAQAFVKKFSAQYGLPEPSIDATVRRTLLAHAWPGNIRELRNAIERALLLSIPGALEIGELAPAAAAPPPGALPFPARLNEIVRAAARAMLEATGGNRSEAARRLGISRSRLQRLLDGSDGDAEAVSE
jgi:DNA-binding NtrC family response regulator